MVVVHKLPVAQGNRQASVAGLAEPAAQKGFPELWQDAGAHGVGDDLRGDRSEQDAVAVVPSCPQQPIQTGRPEDR